MIDVALAAAAIVSLLVAAMITAMDHDAVKRHLGDHDMDHDAAR